MGTWRCKQMEGEMSKPPSRSRDANVLVGKGQDQPGWRLSLVPGWLAVDGV